MITNDRNIINYDEDTPINYNYQGYLGIRKNTNEKIKQRYFELINGQFIAYFKSKEDRLLKGILDLDLIKNIQPLKVLE